MGIKAGLVGLPNVGKSTLFNALTKSQVPAENYPFCTIDPHVAVTEVPDPRMDKLQAIYESKKQVAAGMQFVDIAGLVKGAASGEGLGNKFLSHIREVDLILHILRCFEDDDVISDRLGVDPLDDLAIIVQELMLKDYEMIEARLVKVTHRMKAVRGNNPKEFAELEKELQLLGKLKEAVDTGSVDTVRSLIADTDVETIPLLSSKKFLVIANVSESDIENDQYKENLHYRKLVEEFGEERVIPVCAKVEGELAQLSAEEAEEMEAMMGISTRGLHEIIRKSYANLGLITFFTCGPQEIHAWPILQGTRVRSAAGEIHSDLERGFICSEVFNYDDIIGAGTLQKLKDTGKFRTEGQDYIVRDGDLLNVRFNV